MKKEIKILFAFVLILGVITQMMPGAAFAQQENEKKELTMQPESAETDSLPTENEVEVVSDAEEVTELENTSVETKDLEEKEADKNTEVIPNNTVEITTRATVLNNVEIIGSVKVITVSKETNKKLEGVHVELRHDGIKVEEGITDANGEIIFQDVEAGTYTLVETKMIYGYKLNTEPQEVEILQDGEVVEKIIKNESQTLNFDVFAWGIVLETITKIPENPEQPEVEEPEKPKEEELKQQDKPKEKNPNFHSNEFAWGLVLETITETPKKPDPEVEEPKQPETPKVEDSKQADHPKLEESKSNQKENSKLKEKVETNDSTSMGAMMLLFISAGLLLYSRKK